MNESASPPQTQPGTFQRHGWWWRTMGFTRTHLIGVFVTEIFLGTIAVGFAMVGFFLPYESGTPCLLVAVCLFLAQLSVLLSSILSLLFYMGPGIEPGADSSPASKGS